MYSGFVYAGLSEVYNKHLLVTLSPSTQFLLVCVVHNVLPETLRFCPILGSFAQKHVRFSAKTKPLFHELLIFL